MMLSVESEIMLSVDFEVSRDFEVAEGFEGSERFEWFEGFEGIEQFEKFEASRWKFESEQFNDIVCFWGSISAIAAVAAKAEFSACEKPSFK